jgi:hypothetical protein
MEIQVGAETRHLTALWTTTRRTKFSLHYLDFPTLNHHNDKIDAKLNTELANLIEPSN